MKQKLKYASLTLRFFAFLLDSLIYSFLSSLVYFALYIINFAFTGNSVNLAGSMSNAIDPISLTVALLVQLVVGWFYFAGLEASSSSATMGKQIMRIQVLNADGSRITLTQATIRYIVKSIEIALTSLLFIAALFNDNNQSIHDKFANTFVFDSL